MSADIYLLPFGLQVRNNMHQDLQHYKIKKISFDAQKITLPKVLSKNDFNNSFSHAGKEGSA